MGIFAATFKFCRPAQQFSPDVPIAALAVMVLFIVDIVGSTEDDTKFESMLE